MKRLGFVLLSGLFLAACGTGAPADTQIAATPAQSLQQSCLKALPGEEKACACLEKASGTMDAATYAVMTDLFTGTLSTTSEQYAKGKLPYTQRKVFESYLANVEQLCPGRQNAPVLMTAAYSAWKSGKVTPEFKPFLARATAAAKPRAAAIRTSHTASTSTSAERPAQANRSNGNKPKGPKKGSGKPDNAADLLNNEGPVDR